MTEPLVWQDEVFSDGTPDPAPPVSLPATAEEAKKQLDAIYAPGSTFNWNAPGALDFALGLAHKSAAASADTRSPVGGSVTPSELPPPEATATARQARIEAIQADPAFKAGDHALTIELADLLLGADLKTPEAPELPPELPPVELRPEDLPAFEVPATLNIPADDPAIQALREVTALAELPPAIMQGALARVLALVTKTDPPEDAAVLHDLEARFIAEAQTKHGTRLAAMLQDAEQGIALLAGEHEDLAAILSDARVQNDLPTFEALAALGAKARHYYVRRHGTGGRQVVRW